MFSLVDGIEDFVRGQQLVEGNSRENKKRGNRGIYLKFKWDVHNSCVPSGDYIANVAKSDFAL